MLILVNKVGLERVAEVLLQDDHEGLQEAGVGVHGVGRLADEEAESSRSLREFIIELRVAGVSGWDHDSGHLETIGPHQLVHRDLITETVDHHY